MCQADEQRTAMCVRAVLYPEVAERWKDGTVAGCSAAWMILKFSLFVVMTTNEVPMVRYQSFPWPDHACSQ